MSVFGNYILLLTTLYHMREEDAERISQIEWTIVSNIENACIDRVVILFSLDDDIASPGLELVHKLQDIYGFDGKLEIQLQHMRDSRQTYRNLFDIANEERFNGWVALISNTDILFDASILKLHDLFSEKQSCFVALTRWIPDECFKKCISCKLNKKGICSANNTRSALPYNNRPYKLELQPHTQGSAFSFDSYAFVSPFNYYTQGTHSNARGPMDRSKAATLLDIQVGVAGCDTLLVKRVSVDMGIEVINPCIDIRSYHIDDNYRKTRRRDISYFGEKDYPHMFHFGICDPQTYKFAREGVKIAFSNGKINPSAALIRIKYPLI